MYRFSATQPAALPLRQPRPPNPLEPPYYFTVSQDSESWAMVISHGQHVLCVRRGSWEQVSEWVTTDWPDAHDREAHTRGGQCGACDRQKAWARR